MHELMEWNKLFNRKRLGQEIQIAQNEDRNDFQRDHDRIVFSSSFRRLQSKTQVIPLPESDFVHTRLTHSLETSSVGRSLGFIAGKDIIKKNPSHFNDINVSPTDFGAVVASACLAHDIGNPPFGHSGEDAISEFFMSKNAGRYLQNLNEKQITDLQKFEGNATGFRILTHTYPSQSEIKGGFGLTFSTLGTFLKYPKESLPDLKKSGKASEKKFGFFQSDKDIFKEVAIEVGLISKSNQQEVYKRHPLTFLMEAADDICYHIIDFEDGFNLNLIEFKETEKYLGEILGDDLRNDARYQKILDTREKIGFLRSKVINKLILECVEIFVNNEVSFLDGSFDTPLVDNTKSAIILNQIFALTKEKVYKCKPVLEIESAGFEILGGLLEIFLDSIDSKTKRGQKNLELIPSQFLDKGRIPYKDMYTNLINISLFVSSMTDNYALSLFRKLKGISLPNLD